MTDTAQVNATTPEPEEAPMSTPSSGPSRVERDGGIGSLFREGRLADAVQAAGAAVRARPIDGTARYLLAELLLFTGDHARADVMLDASSSVDATLGVAVAEFRQLLRAETARQQLFSDGRVPEVLGGVRAGQRAALAALVELRAGNVADAARLASEIETVRPHATGRAAGQAFEDMRDADDLLAGTFEVLTPTGKYLWIPIEDVISLDLHPPRRPRDLYWRRATMRVADGPEGDIYLPAIYAALPSDPPLTEQQRLGRATDWLETADGTLVRGVGARTFLFGEASLTLMELTTLRMGASA